MIALLAFAQPLGFAALLVPVLFLIAARERGKAEPRLVGSLEIWRRVAGDRQEATRARKAPLTPRIYLMAAAMTLIAMALAGPSWTTEAQPRSWRIVLDTASSNGLPSGEVDGDGRSRFDLAVARGVDWSGENFAGEEVFWLGAISPDGAIAMEQCEPGSRPSKAFLDGARGASAPRSWESFDAVDCLWLPTSGVQDAPRYAARPALDYAAGPGPVQDLGGGQGLWLDAAGQLVRGPLPEDLPTASLRLSGAATSEGTALGDLARMWAASRGLVITGGEDLQPGEVLFLRSGEADTVALGASASLGRDGWRARGTWPKSGALAMAGQIWLGHRDRALVSWRAGTIELALSTLDQPSGDPAAFAVSWATLFEQAALAGPGIVSVAERRAANLSEQLRARAASASEVSPAKDTPLAPALAILAACLLFAITFRSAR
ncbi:MAG: hypothetical protein ACJAZ8_002622 [Planctomycetota bacterium]